MSKASMLASVFSAEIERFCAQYKIKPQTLSIAAGLSSDCVGQITRRKNTNTTVNKPTVSKLRDAMQQHAAENPILSFQPPADHVFAAKATKSDSSDELLTAALSMLTREQLTEILLSQRGAK